MTKLLEDAFQRVSQLPEAEQDFIAAALLDVFQDDQQDNAAWDALVESVASQRMLEEMARRVEEAIARSYAGSGRIFCCRNLRLLNPPSS